MPFLEQETARLQTALQALAAQRTTLTTQLTTQQQAVTASLEANHKRHVDKKAASRKAALAIIQFSFGKTPEEVVAECRRIEPNVQ